MFTGIVEEVGQVYTIKKSEDLFKIAVETNFILKDAASIEEL